MREAAVIRAAMFELDAAADAFGHLPDGAWMTAMSDYARNLARRRSLPIGGDSLLARWIDRRGDDTTDTPAPAGQEGSPTGE